MTPLAKTIQIYLPTGNPRGIRSAEMATRTVRLIEIPRVHIKEFFAMPEAMQVGLYFLVGNDSNEQSLQLYIGQTGEISKRLEQHNTEKDFWERAFVMLSTNNSITQTHTLYLEHKSISIAKSVGRYQLINGNNGSLPYTPEPLKADCEELFYTLKVLLSTLGQPIFESLSLTKDTLNEMTTSSKASPPKLFYCQGLYADAKGYYDDDGFVILAGSKIRKNPTNSLNNGSNITRTKMRKELKLIDHNDKSYQLVDNHLCNTPSGAAQIVLGRPANGWSEWKNKDGKTLSDIYRADC